MDRLYGAWRQMRTRCRNPRFNKFHLYGGRGIVVCARWDDFKVFAADMGPHPGKGWTLDRYPNKDGNYDPNNCRWATYSQQGQNTRSTKLDDAKVAAIRASSLPKKVLARLYGVAPRTIRLCLQRATWK